MEYLQFLIMAWSKYFCGNGQLTCREIPDQWGKEAQGPERPKSLEGPCRCILK